jgi:LacI family transcriptional regulator
MSDRPKRTGIREVAAAAGVSVTTVSHVLNNTPNTQVRTETRERVVATAKRLGYRPSRLARGLRTRRTQTLGLVGDSIATTPYAGQMIRGAQQAAQERGRSIVLFNTEADPSEEDRDLRTLLGYEVEGIIYATMYHRVVSIPSILEDVPLVLLDAESPGSDAPSVVPDEVQGGCTATQELIDHGHRRVGFITNVDDVPATSGRLEGYRKALRAAKIRVDATLVVSNESETWGGYRAARQLLERESRPTALFAYNDRMAMGAYRAAAELGLRIPADLSIVGFDDQQLITRGLYPELTSVSLPHYAMGYWAAANLCDRLDSASSESESPAAPATPLLMECPLVRRDSVQAPAGE